MFSAIVDLQIAVATLYNVELTGYFAHVYDLVLILYVQCFWKAF